MKVAADREARIAKLEAKAGQGNSDAAVQLAEFTGNLVPLRTDAITASLPPARRAQWILIRTIRWGTHVLIKLFEVPRLVRDVKTPPARVLEEGRAR